METLIVPTEFFTAPECPRCCLFTGRTDHVRRRVIPVATRYGCIRKSYSVEVPLAVMPWAWRVLNSGWFAPVLVLVGVLCAIAVGGNPYRLPVFFWTVWLGLWGWAAVFGLVRLWLRGRYVTLAGMRVGGEVELRFPASQMHRFDTYRQALQQFQERLVRGGRRLNFSGDWTDHAGATWKPSSDSSRATSPDPAEPPPWRLVVDVDFMNSRFLPHRCLYTGRTDRVLRLFTPLPRGTAMQKFEPVQVALPQAPGAESRWWWLSNLWMFVPPAIIVPMMAHALTSHRASDRVWIQLQLILSLAVTFGVLRVIHVCTRGRLVTRTLFADGRGLTLTFPAHQRDNYEAFRRASEDYLAARKHGDLNAPGEPGDQPVAGSDSPNADGWVDADGVDANRERWDQSQPNR